MWLCLLLVTIGVHLLAASELVSVLESRPVHGDRLDRTMRQRLLCSQMARRDRRVDAQLVWCLKDCSLPAQVSEGSSSSSVLASQSSRPQEGENEASLTFEEEQTADQLLADIQSAVDEMLQDFQTNTLSPESPPIPPPSQPPLPPSTVDKVCLCLCGSHKNTVTTTPPSLPLCSGHTPTTACV